MLGIDFWMENGISDIQMARLILIYFIDIAVSSLSGVSYKNKRSNMTTYFPVLLGGFCLIQIPVY